MRVKISYSMDVEEVPSKIADIILDCANKLKELSDSLQRTSSGIEDTDKEITHLISSLSKSRDKLGSVDLSLSDVQQILVGLNNFYNGEQNVSDGRPTMDTGGDSIKEAENTRKR